MPLPLEPPDLAVEERLVVGPTVLVAQEQCPAAADLTASRARTVLDAVAKRGRTVEPRRIAEAHFCTVWFVLRGRRSMWLQSGDDDVRKSATLARDFFDGQTSVSDETHRSEARYLAGVMELVLDPYSGEKRMVDFTRQFPQSPFVPDAWLWIADREASGCGGAW